VPPAGVEPAGPTGYSIRNLPGTPEALPMRPALAAALLLGAAALACTQEPPATPPLDPQPRFGVQPRFKTYPQGSAKQALQSAVEAIEKGEARYLVAHLMDPQFVEARLADRARQFEPAVDVEFARLRDVQKANPDRYPADTRLPDDPGRFRAAVAAEARRRAFAQLVRDVEDKLADDPQVLRDLRRILIAGTSDDGDPVARFTHPEVKDRALFVRKVGDRWYLENRQADEKAEPKKEPDEKKEPDKKDPGK
jgi:hypothetical protein